MWRTPNGDQTIKGKYKKLFLDGAWETIELFMMEEDEEGFITTNGSGGHEPFNSLSNREKVYGLASVTKSLVGKSKSPKLFQWNESIIYAVFQSILAEVDYEIDACRTSEEYAQCEFSHHWRKMISEAEREVFDESDEYIDPSCEDRDEWEAVVEFLADQILHDRDFLDSYAKIVTDNDPKRAKALKYFAGIPEDYYSTPMPLVTDEMFEDAEKFLKKTFKMEAKKE